MRKLVLAVSLLPSLALAAPARTEAQRGFEVFRRVGCYQCHGLLGQGGGAAGPRLAPNPLPAQAILAIVRRPPKEMPPYQPGVLSDADVFAIRAYLATIKPPPAPDTLPQLRLGPGAGQ